MSRVFSTNPESLVRPYHYIIGSWGDELAEGQKRSRARARQTLSVAVARSSGFMHWLMFTASTCINDDESGLHHDYEAWLEGLAPHEPLSRYQHNRTGEHSGDAHLNAR
jgi:hypothetical protein